MKFNKEVLKSKTFWGVMIYGLWNLASPFFGVPPGTIEIGNYIIGTFTGVSAVDRSVKVIEAAKKQQ